MSELTAHIFVYGTGRHEGAIRLVELTENSRPALTLRSLNNYTDEMGLFVPTLENMADDIFENPILKQDMRGFCVLERTP